jgi:hypothetical protein
MDDDRLAEGFVLEDLRAMIKSKMENGFFDDMRLTRNPVDYFLSVKAYSPVQLSNTLEDNTKMIMQGLSLPSDQPVELKPWTISRYDVEFGEVLGAGGL